MPLGRAQGPYPDEAAARTAVADGLRWVAAHVFGGPADGAGSASADVAAAGAPAAGGASEPAEEETGAGAVQKAKRVDEVQHFAVTAPPPGQDGSRGRAQPPYYANPQTAAFCAMLGIENRVDGAQGR